MERNDYGTTQLISIQPKIEWTKFILVHKVNTEWKIGKSFPYYLPLKLAYSNAL
jgi:hypothetical protein